jgi:hypothetical protein
MTRNQDHVAGDSPLPDAGRLIRLRNPLAVYDVELAVLLQRELFAQHGLELGALVKTLAGRKIPFLDGPMHAPHRRRTFQSGW